MRRLMALLACGLATAMAAGAADDGQAGVSRLRLRPRATVCGDTVRLADVLVVVSADPQLVQQIADAPVATRPSARSQTVITHEQAVKRLDELGVNLARVLVGGALKCEVTYQSAQPTPVVTNEQPPLLRATPAQDAPGEKTLADVLQEHVDAELSELDGKAEIKFERAGQEFLRLTTPPWEFNVASSRRDKLGPREFRVTIRRDGQLQRKVPVFAQVHLVRPVVVALRPLSIGSFVRREDVGREPRVFEQATSLGVGAVEAVIGQQVKRFMKAGEMIQPDALKAADMVVRSRPVTVTGAGSNVQVRLTGVALDSGSYGETVRVRLGDARRERQVLRGVVAGVGTVRLAEGEQ